jgi:hypothetical protein
MICPICKLELKDSMKVLGLTPKGIKEFHLRNAHFSNLVTDILGLVSNISWRHRELGKTMPFGDDAVELHKRALEINRAESEEWEGENERST